MICKDVAKCRHLRTIRYTNAENEICCHRFLLQQPTMYLKDCPPELHSYICELACLDDGRTVRSLSLVSRYFREVSRPYLFQSLAISGTNRISILASKLESTPPHLRYIRHLFMSTDASPLKPNHKQVANSDDNSILLRILSLAAPTLETLSFVSTSPAASTVAIARLFRTPFPRLRELSVSGFYPFPSSPGKMPLLERLHLHGNRNPSGLLQMNCLEDACPSLTHVRISGLSMAVSFVLELEESFLCVGKTPFPSKLPTHLHHIVVQPAPPLPLSGKPAASNIRDQLMMQQLEALKPPRGVNFALLPRADTYMPHYTFRQDWIGRLDNMEGCWVNTTKTL